MNLVQITPGAGGMYCGNCFRDNALVSELRRLGHSTLMVPLYLPPTLDELDQSAGTPVFFGGVNVYLDQRFPGFRRAPDWIRRWLSSAPVLRWASGRAAKTRAEEVGDLTVSMLRGELGNQARDLEEFLRWLSRQPHPDVVCLSNALLIGLARRIRRELHTRVACMLQGEDAFLESMPSPAREEAWRILAERTREVDLLVAPSRYCADLMARRLQLAPDRIQVVPNGISLEGYPAPGSQAGLPPGPGAPRQPTIGYFARLCRDKGLDTLVDAFIRLRRRGRAGPVRLHLGGGCGPADEPHLQEQMQQLAAAGLAGDVTVVRNPDRAGKLEFLRSLTVFSVPARYGEAFGLYLLEALATGVPVVQPRTAAFPELVEATGGGRLCRPDDPEDLARTLEDLLLDPAQARALGEAGRAAVFEHYSARRMAENMAAVFAGATQPGPRPPELQHR